MMRMGGGLVMVLSLASAAYAVNVVPNPGFETCVGTPASWTAAGAAAIACDATSPATGAFDLRLTNGIGQMLAQASSDCVVVTPGTSIDDLSFAYRTSAVTVYQVALTVDAYTGTDCTGTNGSDSTGAGLQYAQGLSKDGNWHVVTPKTSSIDLTTNSVRFTVSLAAQAAQLTTAVDFDDLSFSTSAGGSTTTTIATTTTGAPGSSVTSTTGVGGSTTSTTAPIFPGTGNPSSECFVTTSGLAATSDGRVTCVDGDPACDADGTANRACVFRFAVCVAETLPGCQVSSITSVSAKPASLHVAVPAVPVSEPTCGPETQVVVPLTRHGRASGRRMLTLTAENAGKVKRERDHVRFQCRPPEK